MGKITHDTFVCIDCETTGLDTEKDRIIEIAAVKFTFDKTFESIESLIDPQCEITEESQKIHNISQKMVFGKPLIKEILPKILEMANDHIVIGHGIAFDIAVMNSEAKRNNIPCAHEHFTYIDTLRLARLYGDSPFNSLEMLRQHFNIPNEGAHRAMNDVIVNIEVFKKLTQSFSTTEQLLERLKKPIALKTMPLGKHKGRRFEDIPSEYLQWVASKDFDQDLLYSVRLELKNRKRGSSFSQASNPFSVL